MSSFVIKLEDRNYSKDEVEIIIHQVESTMLSQELIRVKKNIEALDKRTKENLNAQ